MEEVGPCPPEQGRVGTWLVQFPLVGVYSGGVCAITLTPLINTSIYCVFLSLASVPCMVSSLCLAYRLLGTIPLLFQRETDKKQR